MTQDTGGSVDYYKVRIDNPTGDVDPYTAECNDLIEAFGMTYAEGNVLKALWRIVAARQGKMKSSWPGARYDAEKIIFFAERIKNGAVRASLKQPPRRDAPDDLPPFMDGLRGHVQK